MTNLDVLVLWRGTPGWFMDARRGGSSGGGSAGTGSRRGPVVQRAFFGGLNLEVRFDPATNSAHVQNRAISLQNANVIWGWRMPPIPAEVFNVNAGDRDRVNRQCTMQPIETFQQRLSLSGGIEKIKNVTWRPTHGDDGPPFYAWFIKRNQVSGVRTHHLHMVERHFVEHWDRLLFRDYLVAHPQVAQKYQALKLHLVATYPNDRVAYTRGKTEFVNKVTEQARGGR